MTSAKKRLLVRLALSALLLSLLATGALVSGFFRTEPTILTIHPGARDGRELAALTAALSRFQSLYPRLSVRLLEGNPSGADVIAAGGPSVSSASLFGPAPTPWSGALWVLGARHEALEEAAATLPGEVKRLRGGEATPDDFRAVLGAVAAGGRTPITLGDSHLWPFLLWLQHWQAATSGPASASLIPAPGPAASGADPYAALRPAFEELESWKARGWFAKEVWNEGWAKGLSPLAEGRAAFALLSASVLDALDAKTRASLEYLPFPRRPGDPAWSIGQALFLGVAAASTHKKEGALLVRYLTSPGVTAELSARTGKPFFAWDPKTGASPTVLSSWADSAGSPGYEALAKELDPAR